MGVFKATLDCVEETPGIVKTVLSVKNYCEDYATKDQLEEIKEMLLEAGPVCQGEKMIAKDYKEGKQFGVNRISITLIYISYL